MLTVPSSTTALSADHRQLSAARPAPRVESAADVPAHVSDATIGVRDLRTYAIDGGVLMSGIDKMKNKAEELGGQGKEAVGDATDNRDLQAEGKADQTKGSLKQAGEKVKDAFK
jgi:uncharacterized protein YjbJ (UPF0337 family)